MARTLKNLALALLNATLLLIALCLFLAWQVAAKANQITETFAASLIHVAPLRDSVEAMRGEVAGLRADLAAVTSGSGEASAPAMDRVKADIDELQARLSDLDAALQKITASPDQMIDRAVTATAVQIREGIAEFRGCTPSG